MNPFTTFTNQVFKNFINIGAISPSSSYLAKKMVKDMKGPVVLELGPGTGVFTKEILAKLPKEGKLIAIEANETFASYLKEKIQDERFILCVGDALTMKKFLREHGVKKVNSVISGLPLGNFSKEANHNLLKEIAECLEEGGLFIQFEYFLAGISAVREFFPHISFNFEFFNLPPAFVMNCRKEKK
ncbi:MAG: methyltransferase domain-containing protein [Candidatus Paceibacterota bacterium]|jgi:phospholipid N-methyltransferase